MQPNHYHNYRAVHGYPLIDVDELDRLKPGATEGEAQLERDRLQIGLQPAAELTEPAAQLDVDHEYELDY